MVRLGEVCNIVGGYAFKSDKFTKDGVPVIRISNLDGDKVFVDDSVCYDEQFWNSNIEYRINKNDILMAMSGATVGKIGLYAEDDKALLNQRVCNIKPIENKIDREFLYFYCKSEYFMNQIQKNAFGCAQPNISIKQLLDFNIRLGTIKFQKDVAEKIAAIFRLIEKRKQQLQKLDELVKARFVEMFGNPITNSKNLDELPLSDLGELGRGVSKHRPRNAPELLGGSYPLIQTGDVANAELYIEDFNATYSELGLQQSKMWKAGTLCITIAANIAETAILKFDACFPDSVVGFNANSKTNNIFMHYWFTFFQSILEAQAPESAQKNINLKILSELRVIAPPIELQSEFVEFVNQIGKSKLEVQKSLDKIETLKKALMQKYFG